MSEERRHYDRKDIFMIAEYRPFRSRQSYAIGITTDFSEDGFCFEAQGGDLKTGDFLEFVLKDPKGELELPVSGEVVWKRDSWYKCIIGVQFHELDDAGRQNLLETVTEYKQKSDKAVPQDGEEEGAPEEEKEERPEEAPLPEARVAADNTDETVHAVEETQSVPEARSPSPVLEEATAPTDEDHIQAMRSASSAFRMRRRRKRPLRVPVVALLLLLCGIALTVAVKQFSISPEMFSFSSPDESPAGQGLLLQPIEQPSEPSEDTPVVSDQAPINEPEAVLPLEVEIPGDSGALISEPDVEKVSSTSSSSKSGAIAQTSGPKTEQEVVNQADDKKQTPAVIAEKKPPVPLKKEEPKKEVKAKTVAKTPVTDVKKTVVPADNIVKKKIVQQSEVTPPESKKIQSTESSFPAVAAIPEKRAVRQVPARGPVEDEVKTEKEVRAPALAGTAETVTSQSEKNLPLALVIEDKKNEEPESVAISSDKTSASAPIKMPVIALVVTRKQDKATSAETNSGGEESDGKWSAAGRTPEGAEVFVDSTSIIWPSRNTIRVKTKAVIGSREFVDLLEIDCLKKLAHVPEGHISANKLLFPYSGGWKDILPESMPGLVSDASCPINRK